MAIFFIIAFLPFMLIAVIIVVIIAAIMAIFTPDTISHFTNTHASKIFYQYSQTASGGGDAPSWLLGKIMEAVFAILYIYFHKTAVVTFK